MNTDENSRVENPTWLDLDRNSENFFTDYTRKSTSEDSSSEIKVITPAPDIILKKGNTELKIKKAASFVQKSADRHSIETNNIPPVIQESSIVQSVNKNAYEIRSDVLQKALDWIKWHTDTSISIADRNGSDKKLHSTQLPDSDQVLDIAKKFYTFVENRR